MNEQQIRMGKIIVLATWLFAAASFFFPFYYWASGPLGRAMFGMLIAVHAVELILFAKTYRACPDSFGRHVLQHMIFGVLHHAEVKQRLAESGASE